MENTAESELRRVSLTTAENELDTGLFTTVPLPFLRTEEEKEFKYAQSSIAGAMDLHDTGADHSEFISETFNAVGDRGHHSTHDASQTSNKFVANSSAASVDSFQSQLNDLPLLSDSTTKSAYDNPESILQLDGRQISEDRENCTLNTYLQTEKFVLMDTVEEIKIEEADENQSETSTSVKEKVTEEAQGIAEENPSSEAKKKKKKISDTVRVQKVLEELSAKTAASEQLAALRYKRQRIAGDARVLLLEYAKELSSAILEEACLLAKHRNSKDLVIADVKLIFGKKFHLDVSGYQPRALRVTDVQEEREEDEEDEEGEGVAKLEDHTAAASAALPAPAEQSTAATSGLSAESDEQHAKPEGVTASEVTEAIEFATSHSKELIEVQEEEELQEVTSIPQDCEYPYAMSQQSEGLFPSQISEEVFTSQSSDGFIPSQLSQESIESQQISHSQAQHIYPYPHPCSYSHKLGP